MALKNLKGRAALILADDDFDIDQITGLAPGAAGSKR